MNELDLSKAVKAGALARCEGNDRYVDGWVEEEAAIVIRAALPYILDAYSAKYATWAEWNKGNLEMEIVCQGASKMLAAEAEAIRAARD